MKSGYQKAGRICLNQILKINKIVPDYSQRPSSSLKSKEETKVSKPEKQSRLNIAWWTEGQIVKPEKCIWENPNSPTPFER